MKKIIFILSCFFLQGLCFAQLNTDKILLIGQNALYFEDFVLSIQYFNKVIAVKPYLAEPYMYRAMAKVQLGDYKGAEEDADNAILRNPFVPPAYYVRGFAKRKLQRYEEALEDFSKAFEYSPNSSFILIYKMDAQANLENYQAALDNLNQFLKFNPKVNELLYEKASFQLALNDSVAAENTLNDFVQKEPKNRRAWSARALFYMRKNDMQKALADYNKAIELKSDFTGDYINRGIILVHNKRFLEALKDYDTAVKLDKTNTLAFYNRALLRANLGDTNNALDDLNCVLTLNPTHSEARLRKAVLEATLGNYVEAIEDYKLIIKDYPHFIPAYMAISEIEKKRGNLTISQNYQQQGIDIERQINEGKNKKGVKALVADNKIMDNDAPKESTRQRTEMFNRFAAQNMYRAEKESKSSNQLRGNIQNNHSELVSERNFVLSLYAKADELRRTNIYHPLLKLYNKDKRELPVKITNTEISLTKEMVDLHFEKINTISLQLIEGANDADLFFDRAMQFALVRDIVSAIKDLDKAILLRPDFALAYFFRANLRYKQIEYEGKWTDREDDLTKKEKILAPKQYNFDSEMILRDYDRVIALVPDFQFSYFNKGNALASLQDFRGAISCYSKAIEFDPGFAEAYYNRGLVYLFMSEDAKGLADLSKAGELGIYKVYNLIQRFSK